MELKTMTLNRYQELAKKVVNLETDHKEKVWNFGLGISSQAGELNGLIRDSFDRNYPMDTGKLRAELGELLWHIANLSNLYGISLEEIADLNIEKLYDQSVNQIL